MNGQTLTMVTQGVKLAKITFTPVRHAVDLAIDRLLIPIANLQT
jgi:hypothetical protein